MNALLKAGRTWLSKGTGRSSRSAGTGASAGPVGLGGPFAAPGTPAASISADRAASNSAAARSALPGMRALSPSTPARRSWFGWLLGRNRRREGGALVQGELLLQNVKPVRNSLRDDDVALVERRQSKVIWESPVAKATCDDQELAWNRLRGRRLENLVVKPD